MNLRRAARAALVAWLVLAGSGLSSTLVAVADTAAEVECHSEGSCTDLGCCPPISSLCRCGAAHVVPAPGTPAAPLDVEPLPLARAGTAELPPSATLPAIFHPPQPTA